MIVTAFFDIGRANSDIYPRSNKQYLESFKFWARIQNQLVVYCSSEDAVDILDIRKRYHLEDKTTIIEIDDVYAIEYDIFQRMVEVEGNKGFTNFRYYDIAMSNRAKYNYIMLLKWWFVADATQRVSYDCNFAWLDFGYNHVGVNDQLYLRSEEFDFKWEYNFSDKIQLSCISNPMDVCLADSLQFQFDCVIGGCVVVPRSYALRLWKAVREAMLSLLFLECMDDDQQLLLMVYKNKPDWFDVTYFNLAFEAFVYWSTRKFTVSNQQKKCSYQSEEIVKKQNTISQLVNKIKWVYRRVKYPDYPWQSSFLIRIKEKEEKYRNIKT